MLHFLLLLITLQTMLNSLFESFLLLHYFFVQGLVAKVVLQLLIVEFFCESFKSRGMVKNL